MDALDEDITFELDDALLNFVRESTKHFDNSHNHIHALKVTQNAHKIMKSIRASGGYNEKFLTYVSMLHDVRDHKYPESISRDEMERFIELHLGRGYSGGVFLIIDNVSFSKENRGDRKEVGVFYEDYLTALSDADRLEAIGAIGIRRCEEFTLTHGGKVPEDVIKHCHEKLLRLLPDGFIKSPLARKMAEPLHEEILDYINSR